MRHAGVCHIDPLPTRARVQRLTRRLRSAALVLDEVDEGEERVEDMDQRALARLVGRAALGIRSAARQLGESPQVGLKLAHLPSLRLRGKARGEAKEAHWPPREGGQYGPVLTGEQPAQLGVQFLELGVAPVYVPLRVAEAAEHHVLDTGPPAFVVTIHLPHNAHLQRGNFRVETAAPEGDPCEHKEST